MLAVEVENVSKRFRRQTVQPSTTLKTAVVDFLLHRRRRDREATFQALRNLTFAVRQGQTLGVIGRNGSGKSTLLKLLAGIYRPDSGRIAVHGKVSALLELGAGFHPEFTGRENVLINGIVLGLSKREIRQRFDAIVRFAEIEAFIDEPVKTYSSGMYMRLGFSVAVHADPEVLLIDEILAVGDEPFQQKCLDKVAELRRQQKTIILVNHDLEAIEGWSDEVLWLEHGEVREWGTPQRVTDLYRQRMAAQEGKAFSPHQHRLHVDSHNAAAALEPNRWGSQHVEIVSVRIEDAAGQERCVYRSGELMRTVLHYKIHGGVAEPVFRIAILRADGLTCYGTDTAIDGVSLPPLGQEGVIELLLERVDLNNGLYYVDVSVQARDGHPYDYHHRLYSFTITSDLQDVGVCWFPHQWTITPSRAVPPQPVTADRSSSSPPT